MNANVSSTAAVGSAAAVTLAAGGTQAVSFGGAGFLILYYIGIVDVLTRLGVLQPGTQVAGASSGALITTSICSGLSTQDMLAASLGLAHACRQQQKCSGSLDRHVKAMLQAHLPPDAWQRCSGTGWIAISQVLPMLISTNHQPEPLLVSDFSSQADLVSAAAASSYLPLWSHWSKVAVFRGVPVVDGAASNRQPCPPGLQCLNISTNNPSWGSEGQLSWYAATMVGVLTDATESSRQEFPPIKSTGPNGTADPALVQLAAENGLDIAPGIYNKMPFSQRDWSTWMLSPADDAALMHMYKLGKADAELWARTKGLIKPAAALAAVIVPSSAGH